MQIQAKLDLAAACAILLTFVGAYALTVSWLGIVLVAAGVIAMLTLFVLVLRSRP